MSSLPTLAELLAVTCQAEVARRIQKPRGYVHRLANGGPLTDVSVVPSLARALHQPEAFVRDVVLCDLLARRTSKLIDGQRESREVRRAIHALQAPQERLAS